MLALALAGCGSGDEGTSTSTGAGSSTATSTAGGAATTTGAGADSATTTSAGGGASAPERTRAVSGTGYATVVPEDWTDGSEAVKGSAFKLDLIYRAPGEDTSFRTNLVVTRENPDSIKGERVGDLEEQIRTQAATSLGAEVPDREDPIELDGEDAFRWTLRRDQSGQTLRQLQVIAIHDDALYTLTLSSADADADAAAGEAALRATIAAWRWE